MDNIYDFLSLMLAVSCGKDYNALFQERIAVQLQTDETPQMGACREGANHVGNQLQ